TPTTSRSYGTPGPVTVGLRVTDDRGANSTTTRLVTVQNRPPAASFTASPSSPLSGQTVSFDASASSDPAGSVTKYRWARDGNGSYATHCRTTPTTSRSYGTPGPVTVGLRVTDDRGANSTTTRLVTVQNRAPLASFTVSPSSPLSGQTVSF